MGDIGDLAELSAREATRAMAAGDLSAEAYAEALLSECAAGASLNAFITLEPERVREAARAADAHRRAGGSLGRLHGLPVPVKDSVMTADLPTTAGTGALRGFRPVRDAVVVARLKGAGALVLGKTNIHELSFGWTSDNQAFGAVHNPYDPSRIPGGSSGGTAAAVAARMAPLGVAEDTQGSIRVPAALSGVCGFRPTTGRYPNDGVAPITPLFDQVGPHARTVDDLALFDAVMTGDAAPLPPAGLRGVRLALVRSFYFDGLDPEVGRVTDEALGRLVDAGVELVETEAPEIGELAQRTAAIIQSHDAAPSLAAWLAEAGAPVSLEALLEEASPDILRIWRAAILPGSPLAPGEAAYAAACAKDRPRLQRALADVLARTGAEAIAFPATMVAATPIGEAEHVAIAGADVAFQTAIARNITPGSTAGLPGLVLPAGLTREGLPVGLELDGAPGGDRALLALGIAVEAALGRLPPPALRPLAGREMRG